MKTQSTQNLDRARAIALELARPATTADPQARSAALVGELATLFGHAEPTDGAPARWPQASGSVDVRVAVLVLSADVVRPLLPPGLELAPQPVVPAGWHPVLVMCAREQLGTPDGAADYTEVSLGVPYVQLVDPLAPHRGPFLYMPRHYLDDHRICRLGTDLHGLEKQVATIAVVGPTGGRSEYRVIPGDAGAPVVSAAFIALEGEAARPVHECANFTIVRHLLEQPTISQALRIVDPDAFQSQHSGPFLATNFVLQADHDGATVEPLAAEITLDALPRPDGAPAETHRVPSLRDAQLGAFRLICPKSVALPGALPDVGFPRLSGARKLKIAVLGGGPAACTAALYLARQTTRYEVSLYTTGFRLGGKCQSWRNPAKAWRVEEHGLHAFLGFYHNAFTAVHDAYSDAFASREESEALYAKAFYPEPDNGLMVHRHGRWTYCPSPSTSAAPATLSSSGAAGGNALVLMLEALLRRIRDYYDSLVGEHPDLAPMFAEHDDVMNELRGELLDAARRNQGPAAAHPLTTTSGLSGAAVAGIRALLARAIRRLEDIATYVWFLWTGVDTMLTIIYGVLRARVSDLSQLDGQDFREWLLANGLNEQPGESWEVVNQVYETLFAHQNADPHADACDRLETSVRPANLAAGVGARWFLLVAVGYSGAPSYRFQYSCAQTMMTPFYLALQRLGARVYFFHTVTGLELTGAGADRQLARVKLSRQAEVLAGADRYEPLIDRDLPGNPPGLRDWPLDPHYDQLRDGDWFKTKKFDFFDSWQASENIHATPVTLEHGRDFDLCVLGIPLGALPMIDSPLTNPDDPGADPRWKRMIDGIAVTQTYSFQLWLMPAAAQMFAGKPRGLLTCYEQPEPSYGDFTPLLAHEVWTTVKPRLLSYFTGASVAGHPPLPPRCGREFPRRMQEQWEHEVETWLRTNYAAFYDASTAPPTFDAFLAALAVQGTTLTGVARLLWQHIIADVEPSNLYVLSQQQSTALRLGQAESGVKGLILCGDWTRTDMNCGCVEAATTSGMLASRAISNEPRSIWSPGF